MWAFQVLGIIFLVWFLIFLVWGNFTVNGRPHNTVGTKLLGGCVCGGIMTIFIGFPIVGIVALISALLNVFAK